VEDGHILVSALVKTQHHTCKRSNDVQISMVCVLCVCVVVCCVWFVVYVVYCVLCGYVWYVSVLCV